jgi:formate dehydrogenase beta subunit
MIVQQLTQIQRRRGWLPEDELRELARRMHTPLYRLEEVSSFFPHFRRAPPPRVEVKVCRDMSCHLAGAAGVLAAVQQLKNDRNLDDAALSVCGVSCLGRCDRAPAAYVVEHPMENAREPAGDEHARYYFGRNGHELPDIVAETIAGNPPAADTDAAHPLPSPSPWLIDVYAGQKSFPPYAAVRRFLNVKDGADRDTHQESERRRILAALETAGLLGMGGAGGRAYKKWADVLNAAGKTKYVVCNADESEPGTFKDRELLLRAPHLVLEGVILGGLVVGAQRGYIYIRHEYEEQIAAVEREIAHAESLGVCGRNLLGSGADFPVEVFVSPGGYICGEQTALIEAMEDKRAEPRNRPPELQTNGLWNMPTLLNNVETLSWVPAIVLQDDGRWFAEQGATGRSGKAKYLGRRFFSISGDVNRPGAYEVPIGITLRSLIEDHAGGVAGGKELKAVALSGPSGGFWPRRVPVEALGSRFVKDLPAGTKTFDILDMELDIPLSRTMGVMMGAGMIVYAEGRDMSAAALNCLEFFRNESCGKCVPCRIGSQKLVEIAEDLRAGKINANAAPQLDSLVAELADTMELTAICGLGTVAANPLASLLRRFPEDVRQFDSGERGASAP